MIGVGTYIMGPQGLSQVVGWEDIVILGCRHVRSQLLITGLMFHCCGKVCEGLRQTLITSPLMAQRKVLRPSSQGTC